jgi:hypothetical protein
MPRKLGSSALAMRSVRRHHACAVKSDR